MTAALTQRFLAAALAATLTGCAGLMQTPYERPTVQARTAWNAPAPEVTAATVMDEDAWWRRFGDANLNALVDLALRSNNDLAAAALRVRRAQLQAGLAENDLWPQFSGGGSANFDRSLDDGSDRSESYSVSLGVSYEADLWGRLASQRDAALWEARATEEDRRSAAVALVGTTMNLYWQAAYLNQRLAAAQASIDYARRTLDLVRGQYEFGAVSRLEVAQAERNLASQEASHEQLLQQRVETLNALAILFDGPPSTDTPVPAELPDLPLPEVAAGLPAELLGRRPDLRAAELRLRGTLATGDAVRASYYPSLSLTGTLGSASTALLNVLQNPIAALGVGVTLPFLQWEQMQLDNAISRVDYETAVVTFRQTLYQAMSEVENALSARASLAAQGELLRQSLDAALETERLYEVRYRSGAVALRDWLDAQEQRRQAEIALAENRLARYANQVTLYQALGGDAAATTVTSDAAGEVEEPDPSQRGA